MACQQINPRAWPQMPLRARRHDDKIEGRQAVHDGYATRFRTQRYPGSPYANKLEGDVYFIDAIVSRTRQTTAK